MFDLSPASLVLGIVISPYVKYIFKLLIIIGVITLFYLVFGSFHYEGKWFFLNPDQVSREGIVSLCSSCSFSLPNKLPNFCIANGMDFGRMDGFPKLSFAECLLISQSVTHFVSLSAKTGLNKMFSGHTISIPHNAVQVVEEAMPRTALTNILCVSWLGNIDEFKKHSKMGLKSMRLLRVSKSKILIWLKFLKLVNPLYADVEIDTMDDMSEEEYEESIHKSLIDDATMMDDEEVKEMDDLVNSSELVESDDPHDDPSIKHYLLNRPDGSASNKPPATLLFLESLFKHLNVDLGNKQERRNSDPTNQKSDSGGKRQRTSSAPDVLPSESRRKKPHVEEDRKNQ
jgi:hypothetical protein